MEEGTEIEHAEPADEIARLEESIEALRTKIENCRKLDLASRAAVVLGGLVLVASVFGAIQPDVLIMTMASAALLGGIVLFGSNSSTAKEAAAELVAVEARRAQLIGQLDLRVVNGRDNASVDGTVPPSWG
jgi:hypothetical protein